jgi:hypothetical protein
MNDTAHDLRPHTLLERHLTVGSHTYLISASGTGDERITLAVNGVDADGRAVGELSGGFLPDDLPALAEAFASTLFGLVALRGGEPAKAGPATRFRNRGSRWSPEDDDRLLTRFREGVPERTLMEEFGRSRGGIRARLETLGAIDSAARR